MKMECPRCPLCSSRPDPGPPISAEQAFCGNPQCPAICWNPSETLDQNLLNVRSHRLPEWITGLPEWTTGEQP